MKRNNNSFLGWEVTKWQYNNIIPIVVSVLMMALSYGALLTRVSVIETKLDIVIARQNEVLAKFRDVEIRYGELALQVKRNEVRLDNVERNR